MNYFPIMRGALRSIVEQQDRQRSGFARALRMEQEQASVVRKSDTDKFVDRRPAP